MKNKHSTTTTNSQSHYSCKSYQICRGIFSAIQTIRKRERERERERLTVSKKKHRSTFFIYRSDSSQLIVMASDGRKLFIYGVESDVDNAELQV